MKIFDFTTLDGVINCAMLMIFAHFIADFVFQTRQMGENKSHSMWWLSVHVHTYIVVLTVFMAFILTPIQLLLYSTLNFWLHFATDFSTSRITSYFYKKAEGERVDAMHSNNKEDKIKHENGRKKWMSFFWLTIGSDQTIHGFCLFLTFKYLIMKDLATDLHQHVTGLPIVLQILIVLVFLAMFIWAATVFIKLFLNLFGISFKKEVKQDESNLELKK